MYGSEPLSHVVQTGLGWYWMLVALLNLGFAAYYCYSAKSMFQGLIWTIVSVVFFAHAAAFLTGHGTIMPQGVRDAADALMGPVTYFVIAVTTFFVMLYFRRFFAEPL